MNLIFWDVRHNSVPYSIHNSRIVFLYHNHNNNWMETFHFRHMSFAKSTREYIRRVRKQFNHCNSLHNLLYFCIFDLHYMHSFNSEQYSELLIIYLLIFSESKENQTRKIKEFEIFRLPCKHRPQYLIFDI